MGQNSAYGFDTRMDRCIEQIRPTTDKTRTQSENEIIRNRRHLIMIITSESTQCQIDNNKQFLEPQHMPTRERQVIVKPTEPVEPIRRVNQNQIQRGTLQRQPQCGTSGINSTNRAENAQIASKQNEWNVIIMVIILQGREMS